MHKRTLYLILATILFIVFIGRDNKSNATVKIQQNASILAFGDSLTYGVGAKPEQSYPAQLSELLNLEVINSGISGQTSSQGLARLEKELILHSPSLVIICLGGNDILRRKSLANLKQNLSKMIEIAANQDVAVLLVAVPEFGFGLSPPDLYHELANEFSLPLEYDILSDLLADNDYKSDGVHLNAKGYKKMAQAIASKIEVIY